MMVGNREKACPEERFAVASLPVIGGCLFLFVSAPPEKGVSTSTFRLSCDRLKWPAPPRKIRRRCPRLRTSPNWMFGIGEEKRIVDGAENASGAELFHRA